MRTENTMRWGWDGPVIPAHGYGGAAFHLWKNVGVDVDNWQLQKVPSRHLAAVTDIAWVRSGVIFKEEKSIYPFEVVVKQKNQNSYGRSLEEPSLKTFMLSISCPVLCNGSRNMAISKWVPGGWKAFGRLQSRSLTVTQMEFSRDDIMLLAVSRDGLFSVFTIKRTGLVNLDALGLAGCQSIFESSFQELTYEKTGSH
ncbi:hypothetical protein NC651_020542 [Populus alba x Populus x berolinensis]|nr:hypothetical protein NC651_020542 [Populus alba x Populus x berolinensis]